MYAVRKDITSLKSFQKTVAKKRYELEKALIISQQANPNSSYRQCWDWWRLETGDFILNLLKSRITNLENEILKKYAIIDYLTKQLLESKSNSLNDETNLLKGNTNDKNKTANDKTCTQGNNGNNSKRKVVATGDSMLNGINERGLSKHQKVKTKFSQAAQLKLFLTKLKHQ